MLCATSTKDLKANKDIAAMVEKMTKSDVVKTFFFLRSANTKQTAKTATNTIVYTTFRCLNAKI
ncbi:hypothetical protein SEQ01_03050 [Streptococcus equinus]|nr:hypothetical protein SEQ01_03050 [Streptococcus equinus]